jgi:hypothetical protein
MPRKKFIHSDESRKPGFVVFPLPEFIPPTAGLGGLFSGFSKGLVYKITRNLSNLIGFGNHLIYLSSSLKASQGSTSG